MATIPLNDQAGRDNAGLLLDDVDLSVSSSLPAYTFDSDTEGWTIFGDATDLTHEPTGGNPGGYISATDLQSGQTWYWEAPGTFVQNLSEAYGYAFSFDLIQSDDTTGQFNYDDIVLIGDGTTLILDTPENPGTEWTRYSVSLDETAGWINSATSQLATKEEIQSVLASLTNLRIRGEHRSGADTGGLDNVVLSLDEPSETVEALFVDGPFAVTTTETYSGSLQIDVTGMGQAAGTSFSDAFYRFTDENGNEITPEPANEFGLYINGQPVDLLFSSSQTTPIYNPDHSYSFAVEVPSGPLTFGVGDLVTVDNTGSYTIEISELSSFGVSGYLPSI